jgi:hypothetical protein
MWAKRGSAIGQPTTEAPRMGALKVFASVLAVAALAAWLLFSGSDARTALVLLLVLLPFLAWFVCRPLLNPFYISPVAATGLIIGMIGTFGYLLRDALYGQGGASIIIRLDEATALRTLVLVSVSATIVIVVGSFATVLFTNRREGRLSRPSKLTWTAPKPHPVILILLALPLVYYLATSGLQPFIERSAYLSGEQGSFASSVITQLVTLAVVLLGFVVARGTGGTRVLGWMLLIAYVLMIGSFGSRRFALIPVLFALGVFLAGNTRKARWGLILGGALTFLLLPLPLDFRSSVTHGIVPYTAIFLAHDWFAADYLSALNNVLIGFPIIGQSAYGGAYVSWSDIAVSLNPLPGDSAGFYDISQRLRLNAYTPMAGIGELGNVGWGAVIAVIGGAAVLLAWFEAIVRERVSSGGLLYAGVVMGLVALFALQMTQYNLRLASRLLTYLLVIEIARRVFLLLKQKKRRPTAVAADRRSSPATL